MEIWLNDHISIVGIGALKFYNVDYYYRKTLKKIDNKKVMDEMDLWNEKMKN